MITLRGSFPLTMIKAGCFRASYFEEDGTPRFQPALRRVSLRNRLRRSCKLRGRALDNAIDFLERCLTIDPSQRITAHAALAHPWMSGPNETQLTEFRGGPLIYPKLVAKGNNLQPYPLRRGVAIRTCCLTRRTYLSRENKKPEQNRKHI